MLTGLPRGDGASSISATCLRAAQQRSAGVNDVNCYLSRLGRNRCPGERHRENVLQSIAASLEGWAVQVKREKAIYHTLNKFSVDVTRKVRSSPCVTGSFRVNSRQSLLRVVIFGGDVA